MRRFFAAAAILLCTRDANPDVFIDPHFQNLTVMGDRIVISSPNGRRIIGLSLNGKRLWERAFRRRVNVGEMDAGSLYVQDGRTLSRISVVSGQTSRLATLPAHRLFEWDPARRIATSVDQRFDRRLFSMLDPETFAVAWETDAIESLVEIGASTVVALGADRRYERRGKGYSLSGAKLVGLERVTGKLKWTLKLKNEQAFSVRSKRVGGTLIVVDSPLGGGGGILCIDPETGRVLSSRPTGGGWRASVLEVRAEGDRVAYLQTGHGKPNEAELHFASVPALEDVEVLTLSAKEILRFWLEGEFILTAGIYDTACFNRSTGARLWERGPVGQWSRFGDAMLINDSADEGQRARLAILDLRSGDVKELYSEPVGEVDRKEFRPW